MGGFKTDAETQRGKQGIAETPSGDLGMQRTHDPMATLVVQCLILVSQCPTFRVVSARLLAHAHAQPCNLFKTFLRGTRYAYCATLCHRWSPVDSPLLACSHKHPHLASGISNSASFAFLKKKGTTTGANSKWWLTHAQLTAPVAHPVLVFRAMLSPHVNPCTLN